MFETLSIVSFTLDIILNFNIAIENTDQKGTYIMDRFQIAYN